MTIAVDFDGTIVEHRYPKIGEEIPFATETLKILAQERHKLILWTVREGELLEEAIEWLVSAGMVNRIYNVSKMEHPLSAFNRLDQFKLFVFDTGLLKYMAGIDNSAILLNSSYQFKGALTENYILQQLHGQFEVEPHYFSYKNQEIDFVLQNGNCSC